MDKEIVILDLREARDMIKKSQSDGDEFTKEIIAIDNALKFLKKI